MERSELSPESPLNQVIIQEVLPTHEDERRAIVEFHDNVEIPFRNMKTIRVKQPQNPEGFSLGNHYHEDVEMFFLESGRIATLILEDPTTGERIVHESLGPNTKIVLPPNVAHLFIFKEAATLLAFSENPFNPANLVPHKINQ